MCAQRGDRYIHCILYHAYTKCETRVKTRQKKRRRPVLKPGVRVSVSVSRTGSDSDRLSPGSRLETDLEPATKAIITFVGVNVTS